MFSDERGKGSLARVSTFTWLLWSAALITFQPAVSNAALAFMGSVATALIAWTAGPRIAQYLGPQIGAVTTGIGQALRTAVAKRRDPSEGIEVTK
jgi:hypothetical protein